jgi:hypothetical protein
VLAFAACGGVGDVAVRVAADRLQTRVATLASKRFLKGLEVEQVHPAIDQCPDLLVEDPVIFDMLAPPTNC